LGETKAVVGNQNAWRVVLQVRHGFQFVGGVAHPYENHSTNEVPWFNSDWSLFEYKVTQSVNVLNQTDQVSYHGNLDTAVEVAMPVYGDQATPTENQAVIAGFGYEQWVKQCWQ
jgi:hypothetical protein